MADPTPEHEYTFDELAAMMQSMEAPAEVQPEPPPMIPEVESSQPQDTAGTQAESTEQDTAEVPQKLSVKALAEKLGIKPAELYDSVEVLEGMTLGQYKDRAKDLQQAEALLAEAQESRLKSENELLQKNQALRVAQEKAGIQLTEDDLAAAQQQTEEYRQLQDRIAVELMPDWSDEAVRHEAEKQIDGLLDEYGYFPAEKPFMVDARLRKMFRDYARLRADMRDTGSKKVADKARKKPAPRTQVGDTVTNIEKALSDGKIDQRQAAAELGKLLPTG